MSKILLTQNKDNIITLAVMTVLLSLVVINIVVLVPSLISVFTKESVNIKANPIDVETVNSAVEILTLP